MALDQQFEAIALEMSVDADALKDLSEKPRSGAFERLEEWIDEHHPDVHWGDYRPIIDRARQLVGIDTSAAVRAAKAKSQSGTTSSGANKNKRYQLADVVPDPANASAPYRFVTLPDEVLLAVDADRYGADLPIDDPLPDGYSATITVEWIAETPLLIGGAAEARVGGQRSQVHPLQFGKDFVIPGSTFRGLLRRDLEILAYGKLTQANLHHRYPLRDFMHPNFRISGKAGNVIRAGFLCLRKPTEDELRRRDEPDTVVTRDELVWEITPASGWGLLKIPRLEAFVEGGDISAVQPKPKGDKFYYPWCAYTVDQKYAALGLHPEDGRIETSHLWAVEELGPNDAGDMVYGLRAKTASGGQKAGVLSFGGPLKGGGNKKTEAVVFPSDAAVPVAIPAAKVDLFQRLHSKPSDTDVLVPEGPWETFKAVLFDRVDERHASSRTVPVFFRGDLQQPGAPAFCFGMTRMFKVPHRYSVGEKLALTQAAHRPRASSKGEKDGRQFLDRYENVDFVERLFGYVLEPGNFDDVPKGPSTAPNALARKGRIAFGFGRIISGTPKPTPAKVSAIQMAPRASFAPFYLRSGTGQAKDWSEPTARLAGRKGYLPRYGGKGFDRNAIEAFKSFFKEQEQMVKESSSDRKGPKEDVISDLHFLVPQDENRPLVFESTIELTNVTAAEIGAVLFALTHNGDCEKRHRHMIGRGKAFGAGQMGIKTIAFDVAANDPSRDGLRQPPQPEEMYDFRTGKGWIRTGERSIKAFTAAFVEMMKSRISGYPEVAPVDEWLGLSDPASAAAEPTTRRLSYRPYITPAHDAEIKQGVKHTVKQMEPFDGYKILRKGTMLIENADVSPVNVDRLMPAPAKRRP